MRKIAALSAQCESLTSYLRVVKANARRASIQLNVRFSRRTRYPFEDELRWKSYSDARHLQLIVEACIQDLNKVKALRLSPIQPGDHCIVTTTARGFPTTEMRCAVYDVEPRPRNQYSYEVIGITKKGELSKRLHPHTIWVSTRNSFRSCNEPLTSETEQMLASWRHRSQFFVEQTVTNGPIDQFVIEKDYLGLSYVKRQNLSTQHRNLSRLQPG